MPDRVLALEGYDRNVSRILFLPRGSGGRRRSVLFDSLETPVQKELRSICERVRLRFL